MIIDPIDNNRNLGTAISIENLGKFVLASRAFLRNPSKNFFKKPCLLNINTHRIYWHAGAGKDSEDTFDRYEEQKKLLGSEATEIDKKIKKEVDDLWKKQLEKQ